MFEDKTIIELSSGYYPEDRADALFACPEGTNPEEAAEHVKDYIIDNDKRTFFVRNDGQEALSPLGCKKVEKDHNLHVNDAGSGRTKRITDWDNEKEEMVEKEVKKPEIIVDGDRYKYSRRDDVFE